jgi:hypothetical protein
MAMAVQKPMKNCDCGGERRIKTGNWFVESLSIFISGLNPYVSDLSVNFIAAATREVLQEGPSAKSSALECDRYHSSLLFSDDQALAEVNVVAGKAIQLFESVHIGVVALGNVEQGIAAFDIMIRSTLRAR